MRSLGQDIRYALRSFRSGRSGLLLSVVVLAVAIGAGTTTYSVVSGVVLRSLPFAEPERLVNVLVAPLELRATSPFGATMSRQSLELVLSDVGAFESAAYYYGSGEPVLTGLGEPERVRAFTVAPEFFSVLGSRSLLGRTLIESDSREGGASAVVLSHRFWVSRFGDDRSVVGRTLTLDGRIYEVVGVMPPRFDYPAGAELWQAAPPLGPASPGSGQIQGRYWLVGRLAPGVTPEQARARLDTHFAAYAQEQPAFAAWGPNLAPLRELLVGTVRRPLLLLLSAVALVLLIACANVASVLLARGATRRRELAIRLSLGASRWRVARQLLTESVLLALLSGAGGVLLALWAVPLVVSLAGDQLPRATEIALDWRILVAALAASTLTGLVAGLLPALVATREEMSEALKDGGQGSGTRSWRVRLGEALVVLQVGLGTLLLTGAALLALSFVNLMRVDFGFEPARAVVAQLRLTGERYASAEAREAFAAEVLERAGALPGVEAAAISTGIPLHGGAIGTIEIPGEEVPAGVPPVWITHATPDYFRVLGIHLLRGRSLLGADRGEEAVVVNQTLARAYFPGQDPIGRTVTYFGDLQGRIVGVVNDTRQQSLDEPASAHIYAPFVDGESLKISVRTAENAARAAAALRSAIHAVDPLLPIDKLGPLSDLVSESVTRERFYAVVLTSFALIALLITALGIFGLTAYSVSRRLRELGIRMALGASAGHIRALTVGHTGVLALLGIVLGLLGAAAATRVLEAFLFGLSPTDPLVFGGVAVLLAGVAVLAAYPSARRAARVDPMIVLRVE